MDPPPHAPAHNHHHLWLAHSWIADLLKARQRRHHSASLSSMPVSSVSAHSDPPTLTRSRTDSSPATATKSSTSPSSSSMRLQSRLDDPDWCSSRDLLEYRQHEWWNCSAQPCTLPATVLQSWVDRRIAEPPNGPSLHSGGIPEWIEYPVSAHLSAESSETVNHTATASTSPDSPTQPSSPPLEWGGMITTALFDDCSNGTRAADQQNRGWRSDEERDPPDSRSHLPGTGQGPGSAKGGGASTPPAVEQRSKSIGFRRLVRSGAATPRNSSTDNAEG